MCSSLFESENVTPWIIFLEKNAPRRKIYSIQKIPFIHDELINGPARNSKRIRMGGESRFFPSAACVSALIDRLVHNAEIITIDADSFRLKDAREQQEHRASVRQKRESSISV